MRSGALACVAAQAGGGGGRMMACMLVQETASRTAEHARWVTEIFFYILLALAAAYVLHLLATLVLLPALRGRARSICTRYAIVGPFILVALTATFLLYVMEFVAFRDIYRDVANPRQTFKVALEDRVGKLVDQNGEESLTQLGTLVELALEDEEPVALENYRDFRESGYADFLDGFFHFTYRVYAAFDSIMLIVLLIMMGRQLWIGSSALLLFPWRRDRISAKALARQASGQLLVMVLYTLGSSAFFLLCSGAVYLLASVVMRMMVDLFMLYSFELASSFLLEPVSATGTFLLLFSFTVMMLEIGLLMMAGALLFGLGASHSIEIHCRRACARLLLSEPGAAPQLKTCLVSFGILWIKLGAVTVLGWVLMKYVVFGILGLTGASYVSVLVQTIAFNMILWWVLRSYRQWGPLAAAGFGDGEWLRRIGAGMAAAFRPAWARFGEVRP